MKKIILGMMLLPVVAFGLNENFLQDWANKAEVKSLVYANKSDKVYSESLKVSETENRKIYNKLILKLIEKGADKLQHKLYRINIPE